MWIYLWLNNARLFIALLTTAFFKLQLWQRLDNRYIIAEFVFRSYKYTMKCLSSKL